MAVINYKYFDIDDKQQAAEIYETCLENKLYKAEEGFTSRLLKVYKKQKFFEGIMVVIAYDDQIPIGVCLVEKRKDFGLMPIIQGGILDENCHQKRNPWKEKFDFYFINTGFLSIYVNQNFRSNGIATEMFKLMEKNILEKISEQIQQKKECVAKCYPLITCREKASEIVTKHSESFTAIYWDFHQDYKKAINDETNKITKNLHAKKPIINISRPASKPF